MTELTSCRLYELYALRASALADGDLGELARVDAAITARIELIGARP